MIISVIGLREAQGFVRHKKGVCHLWLPARSFWKCWLTHRPCSGLLHGTPSPAEHSPGGMSWQPKASLQETTELNSKGTQASSCQGPHPLPIPIASEVGLGPHNP